VELKTARTRRAGRSPGSGHRRFAAASQNHPRDRNRQVRTNVVESKGSTADAFFCWPSPSPQTTEKRVAFGRVMRMTVQRAQRARCFSAMKIQGERAPNGAEIARTELDPGRSGALANTLRADLDYATKVATTQPTGCLGSQGLGVQKGEVLPGRTRATARRWSKPRPPRQPASPRNLKNRFQQRVIRSPEPC